jgi:hypothetical protein
MAKKKQQYVCGITVRRGGSIEMTLAVVEAAGEDEAHGKALRLAAIWKPPADGYHSHQALAVPLEKAYACPDAIEAKDRERREAHLAEIRAAVESLGKRLSGGEPLVAEAPPDAANPAGEAKP